MVARLASGAIFVDVKVVGVHQLSGTVVELVGAVERTLIVVHGTLIGASFDGTRAILPETVLMFGLIFSQVDNLPSGTGDGGDTPDDPDEHKQRRSDERRVSSDSHCRQCTTLGTTTNAVAVGLGEQMRSLQ